MDAPEWIRLAQDGNGQHGGFWTNAAATEDSPKYYREDLFHMHQRGHENSIRAIGKFLRLCDDNGLGDKAREAMKGMEMTDAETIAAVRGALNTEETGENLVEVARAAHAAELRMAYLISDADVEALARAMCEDDGFKWDAKDFGETANGEEPAEQREYWRHKARMAADHFSNVGERHA